MISRFERFSYSISTLYRYIQKIERGEMIKLGYKGVFAQYLVALVQRPEGLTAAQLCEICDKDKAAVSRAIGEMEEKGLLRRKGTGDTMYRAKLVLTQEGMRAAKFACDRVEAAVTAADVGLTEENRTVLYAALDLIAGNLENIVKKGIPE